jgi:hypothetical protein
MRGGQRQRETMRGSDRLRSTSARPGRTGPPSPTARPGVGTGWSAAVTAHAEADNRNKVSCMDFKTHESTNLARLRLTRQDYGQEGTMSYPQEPKHDLSYSQVFAE